MTEFYSTIEEASKAAKILNINSSLEYNLRYKEDPKLPKNPLYFYKKDWKTFGGWKSFIVRINSNKSKCYKRIQEASESAINLGITSKEDYLIKHKQDPKLYILPDVLYWQYGEFNWDAFLGKPFVFSFNEFIKIIRSVNIQTISEYESFSIIKNGMPSKPEEEYHQEWSFIGGWDGVFKLAHKNHYNYREASIACLYLEIYTKEDYINNFHKDENLPFKPELYYYNWESKGGWKSFFDKNNLFYSKIEDASISAINLEIKSISSYNKQRTKDPRLPPNPHRFYKNWKTFGKWSAFLNTDIKEHNIKRRRVKKSQQYYALLKDAHKSINKLGITCFKDYRKMYKKDKMLPPNLPQYYKNEWDNYGGWDEIFS